MDFCYVTVLWRLLFFFFNDTATTEIYTLSLHDALPVSVRPGLPQPRDGRRARRRRRKSPASPGVANHPESVLPTRDLRRIFAKPGAKAARHSCGRRKSSQESTGALPG